VHGIGISDRDGSAAFIDPAALDLTAPRDEHGARGRPTPNERLAGALSRLDDRHWRCLFLRPGPQRRRLGPNGRPIPRDSETVNIPSGLMP
jgi:hypothetical protein